MKIISILFIVLLFSMLSCGGGYQKIEMKDLDPKLRELSDQITTDFFQLAYTNEGLEEFKRKKYITPAIHNGIVNGNYMLAPMVLNTILGKVSSYQLFRAVDKGIVTTMKYKVICENKKFEFVEFKIDINKENKLAKIYLRAFIDLKKNKKIDLLTGHTIRI